MKERVELGAVRVQRFEGCGGRRRVTTTSTRPARDDLVRRGGLYADMQRHWVAAGT